jgi:hypothetical protein
MDHYHEHFQQMLKSIKDEIEVVLGR